LFFNRLRTYILFDFCHPSCVSNPSAVEGMCPTARNLFKKTTVTVLGQLKESTLWLDGWQPCSVFGFYSWTGDLLYRLMFFLVFLIPSRHMLDLHQSRPWPFLCTLFFHLNAHVCVILSTYSAFPPQ
jgi:hypothetical protein